MSNSPQLYSNVQLRCQTTVDSKKHLLTHTTQKHLLLISESSAVHIISPAVFIWIWHEKRINSHSASCIIKFKKYQIQKIANYNWSNQNYNIVEYSNVAQSHQKLNDKARAAWEGHLLQPWKISDIFILTFQSIVYLICKLDYLR